MRRASPVTGLPPNLPARSRERFSRVLPALLLLLLVLRIAFVLHTERSVYIDNRVGDTLPYRERAAEILSGDVIGKEIFFDSPLFPYFLALFGAAPQGPELPVKLVQALLSTASA